MQWIFFKSGSLHCFSQGIDVDLLNILRLSKNCFCNSLNIWRYEWNKEEFRRQQYFMIIRDALEREKDRDLIPSTIHYN